MDVKLGQLGSWLGGRDFTPNGIISAVRRGEETCSDFVVDPKKTLPREQLSSDFSFMALFYITKRSADFSVADTQNTGFAA